MDSEINTDTSMKGVVVLGFARISRNCATPSPTYNTSM
jgi:hypothetical protein